MDGREDWRERMVSSPALYIKGCWLLWLREERLAESGGGTHCVHRVLPAGRDRGRYL